MRDPYAVLGVSADADEAAIRRAYRLRAKRLHPDLHPGDAAAEAAFKELSEAFAIVGEAARRARWDRGELEVFFAGEEVAGGPEPVFGEFFGEAGIAGFRAGQPRRGADVSWRARVPFLLAARGGRHSVRIAGDRDLALDVPAGVADGEVLRLPGQGLASLDGGPPGDALVEVTVEPHPHLRRDGADLHLDLPVTLAEALNGGVVAVATPAGSVAVRLPAGSNSDTRLRLRGRGLVRRQAGASGCGDLFLRLIVTLPQQPDSELRLFLAGWCAQHPYDPRQALFTAASDSQE